MHLLPLSCEGSAMWGPGHGCLDSEGNPLTSPHGIDEADLHSEIKTNATKSVCCLPWEGRVRKHSKWCLPTPCAYPDCLPPHPHKTSVKAFLTSLFKIQQRKYKPIQAFSSEIHGYTLQPLKIHILSTGEQQQNSTVEAGPQTQMLILILAIQLPIS